MKKGKRRKLIEEPGPSAASLREMPEISADAVGRPNPYAARYKAAAKSGGIHFHVTPGRPKKGTSSGPTSPRSVRFPDAVWKHLETQAKRKGMTLHAALRAAVLEWGSK